MNRKALDIIEDCYADYGRYVNSTRALVSSMDGLKTVQRRVLLSCSDLGKMSKCAKIVGHCIGNYHPHGDDATYDTLVNLVTSQRSLLTGDGSFGCRGLQDSGAAAMRYTEANLSDLGRSFLEFKSYAPSYTNDLKNDEPYYIPTMIPYSLLAGTRGIGVGCTAAIPPCNVSSMIQFLKSQNTKDVIIPGAFDEGNCHVEPEEIEKFNKRGRCTVTLSADVNIEWHPDDNQNVVVVSNIPELISPNRAELAFKQEISEGLVGIREESTATLRIVVGRRSRVRRLNDEELLTRTRYAYTKRFTFVNAVSDNGIVRILTPHSLLLKSLSGIEKAYSKKLTGSLDKVIDEIKFNSVKKDLANKILKGINKPTILKELNLTYVQYDKFAARTIGSLISSTSEVTKLNAEKLSIENRLSNVRNAVLRDILQKVKFK